MLFPHIGRRSIREVTPPELLATLRKIGVREYQDSAHRAKQKWSSDELRGARWAEFDLDGAESRIPAERMKMVTYTSNPSRVRPW
jgi:hypothetical protein